MTDNSATPAQAAQEVASRVEQSLFPEIEPKTEEPIIDSDVANEDANKLPEIDDTDLDDDGETDDEVVDGLENDNEVTLADYLGVDEDKIIVSEDGSVSLNTVIDGETKPVPLKDLVSSYQMQGHVNNKSMALETDKKQFGEEKDQVAREFSIRLDGIDTLGKALEQQIMGEYNSIDWDRLRVENSAEWTAMRQEFSERASNVQKMQALAQQERQRLMGEHQQNNIMQRNEFLTNQRMQMLAKNEGWKNPETFKKDMGDLRTFATEQYGFTPEELTQVHDHRLLEILKDAKSFRQGKTAVVKKKLTNLPKFQKSGAPKANSSSLKKARAVKAHKKAIRDSGGSVDAIARSIVDRM